MSASARSSASSSGLGSPPLQWLFGAAMAVLLCLLFEWSGAATQALEAPTRWTLRDQNGDRWGLLLLQQTDPAYSPGWRPRLNALGSQPPVGHQRPLRGTGAAGTCHGHLR